MADDVLQKPPTVDEPGVTIHAIPGDFYGGKNPAPPEIPTRASAPSAPIQPKITPRPQAASVRGVARAMPVAPQSKLFLPLAIGGAAVVILGGGFGTWWFLVRQTPPPATPIVAPPIQAPAPAPTQLPAPVTTTPEIATSTLALATSTPPLSLVGPHTYADSTDSDNDGVTDIEEELWGTNPQSADTDGDGYPDQVELFNLYNPAGVAPQRLSDTKLINTYINPAFNYLVYYQKDFLPSALDDAKREILFTITTGEYIEINAVPYPTTSTFPDWFGKNLPGEDLTTYQPFKNRFGVTGIMSPDKTIALISDGTNVYVFTYNGGGRTEINYRTTFRMMVQSFKPANVVTPFDLLPTTATGTSTTSAGAIPALTTTTPATASAPASGVPSTSSSTTSTLAPVGTSSTSSATSP